MAPTLKYLQPVHVNIARIENLLLGISLNASHWRCQNHGEKLSINFCPFVLLSHGSMFVRLVSMSMSAPKPSPSSLWLLTPLAAETRWPWKPSQGWGLGGSWRGTLARTRTIPGQRLGVLIVRDNAASAMMASRHPTFAPPEVDGDPDKSVYSVINLTIHTITFK